MVHIAAAYAKHTNRLQTFACTSSIGPGATNMITGAAGATINRLPVLLFPSDYFANRLVDPVLQQLEHPSSATSASTTRSARSRPTSTGSRGPEQLLSSLPEAIRVLTDPAETGAVTSACPRTSRPRPTTSRPPSSSGGSGASAARARARGRSRSPPSYPRAKRPLIVAGGGAIYSEATAALDAFATRFGIPVAETQAGKGALPWDHPMNVGPIGANGGLAANRLARDADLVIAIGTRLGDFVDRVEDRLPAPGGAFVAHQRRAARRRTSSARSRWSADARAGPRGALDRRSTGRLPHRGRLPRARSSGSRGEWDGVVDELRAVEDRTAWPSRR